MDREGLDMFKGSSTTYHVFRGDEGVVDGDELDILAPQSNPRHEAANPPKP